MSLFCRAVIIALFLTAAGPSAISQQSGYYTGGGPDNDVEDVSLIRLIANPEAYGAKRVRITGFLRLEFEGNAIYLHPEDFEYGIRENGLWIDAPRDMTKQEAVSVSGRYVICTGTFRARDHRHMGLFSGAMAEITRLEPWQKQ